jgi:PAS domain S-box-containing protein
MNKEQYIQQELLTETQFLLSLLLFPCAGITILLLSLLDYFVTPENFTRFLAYRVITVSLIMGLYFILRLRKDKILQSIIILLGTVTISTMVEVMIFSFGGHQSTYYAGMIVVLVFVLGFLPLSIKMATLSSFLVCAIYFVPIIIFDNITDLRIFMNNIIFLSSFAFGGLAWRYYNYQLLLKKLSLEYDLSQDKEELQKYSAQLEDLVAERTQDLEISEQRYRELFDSANDGIVVFDEQGVVLDVNREFCEMYGFDKGALLGANLTKLDATLNEAGRNERMKRILSGEPLVFEAEHHRQNGDRLIVEVSSKAIEIRGKLYVQSFYKDITDKKRLLAQLFQSQKMESIGLLAGGIAHDFNNFLTAILGHAELLGTNEELDATSRRGIRIIESTTRKAGQVVSKLLSFARQNKFLPLPLNFNDVMKDAVELLERVVAKKKVALKVETDNNVKVIKGDGTQLEQVIMNLVMNAVDAMPEGGTITLSTSLVNIGRNGASIHPLLSSGKYVCLKVTDTGVGIPDEIKDRIFDPFFTTKGPERGTGLGLAIIYGIVREHNGVITVTSLLGRGTTFEVYLPAVESGFFSELS